VLLYYVGVFPSHRKLVPASSAAVNYLRASASLKIAMERQSCRELIHLDEKS
jgi:hypothetical protein